MDSYDPLAPDPQPTVQEMFDKDQSSVDVNKLSSAPYVDTSRAIADGLPRSDEGYLSEGSFNTSNAVSSTTLTGKKPARRDTGSLKSFEVNFNDTSLRTVLEFIFKEHLKKPYIISTEFVDKPVNWVATGNYTEDEIAGLFDMFLDVNGVSVTYKNGTYIASSEPQRFSNAGSGAQFGQAVQSWQLKFVTPSDLQAIVRQFVNNANAIQLIPQANTLVASGSQQELRQISTFINRIDLPDLEDKTILVYAPRILKTESLAALIQNLPTKMGLRPRDRNPAIEAEVVAGTNRIVVVTQTEELRDVVKQFIHEMDKEGTNTPQVFYYPMRNQDAEEIQQTLQTLVGSMKVDNDKVELVVHASTNSLLILATPAQYYQIRKIIERLDYTVPSVMIDATILEVSLDENLAYGVQWFLRRNGIIDSSNKDLTLGVNLSNPSIVSAPGQIGLTSLSSSTSATIDLLASTTDLRILSRPRLLVRNQATATIKSTDKIRVLSAQFLTDVEVDDNALPTQEFEVEEVGITLSVTPNIADDGTITMVVEVEDSNQGPNDTSTGVSQPTFNVRQITTELVIKDTQTVLIGGLIETTNSLSESKVPVLGDIPILGKAFSNNTESVSRSELVILITPYIVSDQTSAQILSEAFSGITLPEFKRAPTQNVPYTQRVHPVTAPAPRYVQPPAPPAPQQPLYVRVPVQATLPPEPLTPQQPARKSKDPFATDEPTYFEQ